MKIREFVENAKDKFIGNVEEMVLVNKYIPVQKKRILARDILDRCVDDADGFIVVDKFDKEIYFTVAALSEYTCLEFSNDYDTILEEYDALCSAGYLDMLIEMIGLDFYRFEEVFRKEKDAILSRNSVEAQVAKVANSLVEAIDGLAEKLNGAIGDFDVSKIIPEGTNVTQIMDLFNKYK